MYKKLVNLVRDFINGNISLEHDYTHEELLFLMQLDHHHTNGAKVALRLGGNSFSTFIDQRKTCMLNELPLCDNIKLRDIISGSSNTYMQSNTRNYVFDVTISGVEQIMCQYRKLLFDDDRQTYYTHKPYYLDDYYVFTDTSNLKFGIRKCDFLNSCRAISPPISLRFYDETSTSVYHFKSGEDMTKAKKLLNDNIKLFTRVYHDRKIDSQPPHKHLLSWW